ncbi:MAG: TonB-dependent receptor [Undibacterium sp.]|nr:TonB-dependent receptor [Opitutaceae bacterium]
MSHQTVSPSLRPSVRLLRIVASAFVILGFVGFTAHAADAATGSLTGSIASAGTKNALQGAAVTLPALNRTELTDSAGVYVFQNVPAGPQELVVGYSGFTETRERIVISPGQTARLDVALKSADVVSMAAFTVETQKEGQALSISEQRNSPNVKTAVALDEWGILPSQNVGELLTRLPGISFITDDDNLILNVTIRGQVAANGQSATRLVLDGMSATGVGGNGRTATLHSFSASSFEALEVINGQTPDKRADGFGAQINLKSRSPLAMQERRRFNYSYSNNYAPTQPERATSYSKHPFSYSGSAGYTEVFDAFGGTRNLGIAVNASNQQVTRQFNQDLLGYENTVNPNAALRDYDRRDGTNHRFITGLSLRADYRLAKHTTVSARYLYNAGSEPFFNENFINPFVSGNQTYPALAPGVPVTLIGAQSAFDATNNPNGAWLPVTNPNRTEIRPVGNAQMNIRTWALSFVSKNPTATLVFEHDLGKLKIDHAWRQSSTKWDSNAGRERQGGQLSIRTNQPIGFVLDKTDNNDRVFTQTAGASVYDAASYTPFITAFANATATTTTNATTGATTISTIQPVNQTSSSFVKHSTLTETDEWSGTVNATYNFETAVPFVLKAGFDTVNRKVNNRQVLPRRWYQQPGTVLTGALTPITAFEEQHGGQRPPVFDVVNINNTLGNSALWYEDVNFTATSQFTSLRIMKETVDAGYIQAVTKLGRLNILGGVRFEKTKVSTLTYLRARSTPLATEPDPFKRAILDYNAQATKGGSDKSFPSLHLAYDLTANFKLRASYSTSYLRPDLLQLVPAFTFSDTLQTVTIGNPDLRPEMAENVDIKLEYYSKTGGIASIGVFRRWNKDRISTTSPSSGITIPNTPDNGFDGLYGGYTILRPVNNGTAVFQGLEFDFRQRLSFLPGYLKGLTARGNISLLSAKQRVITQFEAVTGRALNTYKATTKEIPFVVPVTANFGLLYAYQKFGASFDLNFTDEYATNQSYPINNGVAFTNANGNIFRDSLLTMAVGVSYRIRPYAQVFLNVNNIAAQGPRIYTYQSDRLRQDIRQNMSLSVGVAGQF